MCGGFPCKCCKPIVTLDEHFDDPVPWRCLFTSKGWEVNDVTPISSANWSGGAVVQRFRYAGARPQRSATASSKWRPPSALMGGSTQFTHAIMARMRYTGDTWAENTITGSVNFDFDQWSTGDSHTGEIILALAHEQDEPGVTYSVTASALPRLEVRLLSQDYTFDSTRRFVIETRVRGSNGFSTVFLRQIVRENVSTTPPVLQPYLMASQTGKLSFEAKCYSSSTVLKVFFNDTLVEMSEFVTEVGFGATEHTYASQLSASPRYRFAVMAHQRTRTGSVTSAWSGALLDRIQCNSEVI